MAKKTHTAPSVTVSARTDAAAIVNSPEWHARRERLTATVLAAILSSDREIDELSAVVRAIDAVDLLTFKLDGKEA